MIKVSVISLNFYNQPTAQPSYYGTRRYIIIFTRHSSLTPSSARLIQSTPILFLEYPFQHYPNIYAYIFQVVSFPSRSLPEPMRATPCICTTSLIGDLLAYIWILRTELWIYLPWIYVFLNPMHVFTCHTKTSPPPKKKTILRRSFQKFCTLRLHGQ